MEHVRNFLFWGLKWPRNVDQWHFLDRRKIISASFFSFSHKKIFSTRFINTTDETILCTFHQYQINAIHLLIIDLFLERCGSSPTHSAGLLVFIRRHLRGRYRWLRVLPGGESSSSWWKSSSSWWESSPCWWKSSPRWWKVVRLGGKPLGNSYANMVRIF